MGLIDNVSAARTAPKGQFRVLAVDTWNPPGDHQIIGDFPSLDAAMQVANKHAASTKAGGDDYTEYYVYDDQGEFVAEGGNVSKGREA